MSSVETEKNGKRFLPPGDPKAAQRQRILRMVEQHLRTVHESSNIGELVMRFEISRGGVVNEPRTKIKYIAQYEFLEIPGAV